MKQVSYIVHFKTKENKDYLIRGLAVHKVCKLQNDLPSIFQLSIQLMEKIV